ncbi:MAG: S1C family serine protease [Patescibacteria group bacterium]
MKKIAKIVGLVILVFIIGAFGGLFVDYVILTKINTHPVWSQSPIVKEINDRIKVIKTTEKVVVEENDSIADIASRAAGSVVYVETVDSNGLKNEGNGVVVSSDGTIVTSSSVVAEGDVSRLVKLADGSVHDIKDVYFDNYSGLVFLTVDTQDLATISFANSDDARSGKRLISISRSRFSDNARFSIGGFLCNEYTLNIAQPKSDFLQGVLSIDFSESVLEQNIGSPVVDFHGNMIGLVSKKNNLLTGEESFHAISANDIQNAFDDFLRVNNEMELNHVLLGVNYDLITALDVHVDDISVDSGARIKAPLLVQNTPVNSLAMRSGLKDGDIVVMVNNETVDTKNNLARLMYEHSNDDSITLKVLRSDEIVTINILATK